MGESDTKLDEAKVSLDAAASAVSTAALILRLQKPFMKAFLKESRDMENFGHIVDPTLYRNSERRAVSAIVTPLFQAAVTFVEAHDAQLASAKGALAQVKR